MAIITGQDTTERTLTFNRAQVLEILLVSRGLAMPAGGESGDVAALSVKTNGDLSNYTGMAPNGLVQVFIRDVTPFIPPADPEPVAE